MSDRVTNVETEDVLSSVRRLVSSGTHMPPKAVDRLLLTPAQRVQGGATGGDKAGHRPTRKTVTETAKTLARYEARTPDPVGSDNAPRPRKPAPGVFILGDAARLDRPAEKRDAGASKSGIDTACKLNAASDPSVAQDVAQEMSGSDVFAFIPSDDRGGKNGQPERGTSRKDQAATRAAASEKTTSDVAAEPAPSARASSLESKIAELEAMVAQGGAAWDPATEEEAEPQIGTAQRSAMSVRRAPSGQDPLGRAQAISGEIHTDRHDSLVPADGTVLDEAILREIVSEIVRDELQGVLGERITRNVRNLVRREVNRALLIQDFN
ncbi:hypothetical protein [Primorskyibacter flagellatus]|uniref:Uncharacterized protein n=1 Tax=Primorskyibacter flagellatus TaxID=1387277 RepID=A0A1W2B8G6_9RHOB|nr:hypothetical protein [Primorskyibacter flagellatus]SMC69313.1 hypothetical protein SAMN06295998_103503 [Primorskyibacter flagellatus]